MKFTKRIIILLYFFMTGILCFLLLTNHSHATISSPQLPDISQMSFSDLSPIQSDGEINLPPSVIKKLKFDPNRSWQKGQSVDNTIQLGDLSLGFEVEKFRLRDMKKLVGVDLKKLSLKDFGVMQFQTIASLAKIPSLKNKKISTIPPLEHLIKSIGCGSFSCNSQTIEQVASIKNLANIPLSKLPLGKYKISDIPGLPDIPLSQFNQWEQTFLSEIPGLPQIPFGKFPSPLSMNGVHLAQIDVAYSSAEASATKSVSGSYEEGFTVPCSGGCSHLELTGNKLMVGREWVSGKSQRVKGGHGVLGSLFGGKEPTGRHPFGKRFKVVVGNVDEPTGTAESELYFRFCKKKGWVDLGCSPYGIGPFPFITFDEKDWIFF